MPLCYWSFWFPTYPSLSWSDRKERSPWSVLFGVTVVYQITVPCDHIWWLCYGQLKAKEQFHFTFSSFFSWTERGTHRKRQIFPCELLSDSHGFPHNPCKIHTEFRHDWGNFCVEKLWFSCVTKVRKFNHRSICTVLSFSIQPEAPLH